MKFPYFIAIFISCRSSESNLRYPYRSKYINNLDLISYTKSLQELDNIAYLSELILQFLFLHQFKSQLFFLHFDLLLRIEIINIKTLFPNLNRQPLSPPLQQIDLPPKERVTSILSPYPLRRSIKDIIFTFDTIDETEPRLDLHRTSGCLFLFF